jgi:RsiW-degrading membrane proteinase PrsW (M82 family)
LYLWNTKALINDLRNEQVTQEEQLKYFLLGAVLVFALPERVTLYHVVDIVILILGVLSCYNANSKGDNKDFIVRLTCLAIPLSIRIFLPSLFFMIVLTGLFHNFLPSDHIIKIVDALFTIILFYFLRSAIIRVSEIQDQNFSG